MNVFNLQIEPDSDKALVRLRLQDQHGAPLAASQVRLADHPFSMWQGVFEARAYVDAYSCPTSNPASKILDEISLAIGQKLMGPDIMARLAGDHHRTLLLRLPDTTKSDPLAAALCCLPWDLARSTPKEKPLFERNLVVRAVVPGTRYVATEGSEADPLCVLLVFAEAPGSRPLAMRLERHRLLSLFFDDILAYRRVEVDVLCHGVTRARLEECIKSRGGYRIVHWSGHGHKDCLELLGPQGRPELLSGRGLVQLISDAGGFIPRLVFLSACSSAALVEARNWEDIDAAMGGKPRVGPRGGKREMPDVMQSASRYTGAALELIRAGVPQVIAMRYEISDDYAIQLACRFYQHLLAGKTLHPTDKALSLARGELARAAAAAAQGRQDDPLAETVSGFDPVDHAAPVLIGEAQPSFQIPFGKSSQLLRRRARPQPLLPGGSRDLDPPPFFVGRSHELTRLANEWLPRRKAGVALIQGLAGLGKSSLAAEAIDLWHSRFDHVLAFQARPTPLGMEQFFRQVDLKLQSHSNAYLEACRTSRGAFIYLPSDGPLKGVSRHKQMCVNLTEALRNENILLVIDNFEGNLQGAAGDHGSRCQDPEWDELLAWLVGELPLTGSRLLLTSRHQLEALRRDDADQRARGFVNPTSPPRVLWLPLGPLAPSEAALYMRSHDALRRLHSSGSTGRQLVHRVLQASRGHPLVLDRLAELAHDVSTLSSTLDQLETRGNLGGFPDLFASPSLRVISRVPRK